MVDESNVADGLAPLVLREPVDPGDVGTATVSVDVVVAGHVARAGQEVTVTTVAEIKSWFDQAVAESAGYMIVVCDTFDHSDYPVFCKDDAAVLDRYAYYCLDAPMQKIMEVYDVSLGWDAQKEGRVLNLPKQRHG